MTLAGRFSPEAIGVSPLVLAVLGGVLGAVLSVVLQRIAVWLVGFAAGGYVGVVFADQIRPNPEHFFWMAFIIGGILGAILMAVLFEWALILLSAVTGAFLIVSSIPLPSNAFLPAWVLLTVAGILIQRRMKSGRRASSGSTEHAD